MKTSSIFYENKNGTKSTIISARKIDTWAAAAKKMLESRYQKIINHKEPGKPKTDNQKANTEKLEEELKDLGIYHKEAKQMIHLDKDIAKRVAHTLAAKSRVRIAKLKSDERATPQDYIEVARLLNWKGLNAWQQMNKLEKGVTAVTGLGAALWGTYEAADWAFSSPEPVVIEQTELDKRKSDNRNQAIDLANQGINKTPKEDKPVPVRQNQKAEAVEAKEAEEAKKVEAKEAEEAKKVEAKEPTKLENKKVNNDVKVPQKIDTEVRLGNSTAVITEAEATEIATQSIYNPNEKVMRPGFNLSFVKDGKRFSAQFLEFQGVKAMVVYDKNGTKVLEQLTGDQIDPQTKKILEDLSNGASSSNKIDESLNKDSPEIDTKFYFGKKHGNFYFETAKTLSNGDIKGSFIREKGKKRYNYTLRKTDKGHILSVENSRGKKLTSLTRKNTTKMRKLVDILKQLENGAMASLKGLKPRKNNEASKTKKTNDVKPKLSKDEQIVNDLIQDVKDGKASLSRAPFNRNSTVMFSYKDGRIVILQRQGGHRANSEGKLYFVTRANNALEAFQGFQNGSLENEEIRLPKVPQEVADIIGQ